MTNDDRIMLTRGECIAIALILQTREKRADPAIEVALASAETKLTPLLAAAYDKAFDDLRGIEASAQADEAKGATS